MAEFIEVTMWQPEVWAFVFLLLFIACYILIYIVDPPKSARLIYIVFILCLCWPIVLGSALLLAPITLVTGATIYIAKELRK